MKKTKNTRKYISPKKRVAIFFKTNNECFYCEINLYKLKPRDRTLDHIHHKYLGGNEDMNNLVGACRKCNSARGPKSIEDHKMYILDRIKKRGYWEYRDILGEIVVHSFDYERLYSL
jgi:5-methylcytosine-specific restriction endonuclease McrA